MEHEIVPNTEEHPLQVDESRKGSQVSLSCSTVCSFFNAEFSLSDAEQRSKSATKLCVLIICYLILMAIEIAGGVKSNSLAVLTDAAHLLSDIVGFLISLFTVWASGWGATSRRSFGFHRLEVLGAFASVELIWSISGTLIYAAIGRMLHKNDAVDGKLMFIFATIGFVINLIIVLWLGHGDHGHNHHHSHDHGHIRNHSHDGHQNDIDHHGVELREWTQVEITRMGPNSLVKSNINIQGAYLHIITDLIQTIGVMIAGAIIWAKPNWLVVDLICTLVFAFVALTTTIPMLRNIYCILLESTPNDIDVDRLKNDLKCMEGIKDVHDMHIWALTGGKTVLACHIVIAMTGVSLNETIHKLTDYFRTTYGIHHVTIQIEEE